MNTIYATLCAFCFVAALPGAAAEPQVVGGEELRWLPTKGLVGGSTFDGSLRALGDQSVEGRMGLGFRIGEGEGYALRGRGGQPVGDWERDQAFSVSFWLKADVGATGLKTLVARKEASARSMGWGLYLYAGAGVIMVELGARQGGNVIRVQTEQQVVVRGEWHQVVVTYDGLSKLEGVKVFVDGVGRDVEVSAGKGLVDSIRVAGDTFVGCSQGGQGKATDTTMDDVRLFDRVLEDMEIRRLGVLYPGRVVGKATRVRISRSSGVLMLAEVEAFVGTHNVASAGQASQNSTYQDVAVAQRAIDGNTAGQYGSGSVSHTKGGANQWWQVDFAFPAAVDRLVVWNREDSTRSAAQLSGSLVEVFDENGGVLWTGTVPKPAPRRSEFRVNLIDLDGLRPE